MRTNKISTSRLAKLCGVSQGTIDRALNNRSGISQKTKEHILSVAKEYGYRPNTRFSNKTIGILVFDLYNEYFSELVMILEQTLRSSGYCSLVMFSDKNKETELECIEAMYNAGVEGIILCPINNGVEFQKYLKSWNIPVVTVGNKVDGIKYVGVDNYSAMKALSEFVISCKPANIIYFSPDFNDNSLNTYAQKERFRGFEDAVSDKHIDRRIINDEKTLLKFIKPETAIIASTDVYALKILFSGIANNCLVVGFDNIPSIQKYHIPLISVDSNKQKHAEAIVDYLKNPQNDSDEFFSYQIIGI